MNYTARGEDMKRWTATILLCFLNACAGLAHKDSTEGVARTPANEANANLHLIDPQLVPTDALDDRFERIWKDVAAEKTALKKLADLNGAFVHQADDKYRKWDKQVAANPQRQDRQAQVVKDFPQRPSGSFATRAVHKKNHGCYPARVSFNAQAPGQGLFQNGSEYDAVIRFSNGGARDLTDIEMDSRGMALKLLPKGMLTNSTSYDAQTFNNTTLLNMSHVNYPTAFMFDPEEYWLASSIGLKEYSTPNPTLKPLADQFLAGANVSLRTRVLAGTFTTSVILNPLYQDYYSMVSFRVGRAGNEERSAAKYIFRPCNVSAANPDAPAWTWQPTSRVIVGLGLESVSGFTSIPNSDFLKFKFTRHYRELRKQPNFLRANAQTALTQGDYCFNIQLQKYIGATETPIEDPTEVWLENEAQRKDFENRYARLPANSGSESVTPLSRRQLAPPITIGQIVIPALSADDIARINGNDYRKFCEDLSFNTWDNVAEEHKPLGVVSRMRWHAYRASVGTRHKLNGQQ